MWHSLIQFLFVASCVVSLSRNKSHFVNHPNYHGIRHIHSKYTNYTDSSELLVENPNTTTSIFDLMQAMPPELTSTVTQDQFSFVISETNLDNPYILEKDGFVEIRSVFHGRRSGMAPINILKNYKLITVTCSPLEITSAIDFGEKSVKIEADQIYIVVGFGINSQVPFTSKAAHVVLTGDKNGFGNCGSSSCAIILLKNKNRRELNEVILRRNMQNQFIPHNIENDQRIKIIIRKSAVDAVFYGARNAENQKCSFFESILAENKKQAQSYLRRDTNEMTKINFPSLNYCSDVFHTFSGIYFEQGKSSRGAENICTGKHHIIGSIGRPLSTSLALPPPHMQIPKTVETATQSNVAVLIPEQTAHLNTDSTAETNLKVTSLPGILWSNPYQKHEFRSEWKSACKHNFPNSGRYEFSTPHVTNWLEVAVVDSKCRFSCHACKTYYNMGFRVDVRSKKAIVSETGFFSSSKSTNQNEILNHENDKIHSAAVHFLHQLELATNEAEYNNVINAENLNQELVFKATSNIIKTVYTMIKGNIPFAQLPRITKLLGNLEVPIGTYHHNDKSAHEIASVLSSSFHKKLLNSLISEKRRFTLLCDESTDRSHVSHLIVYLQTLEDNYPITYYYALVQLTDGQSAEATFRKFQEKLEADNLIVPGFIEYFKFHIALLVTDNAMVMTSDQNSFFSRLNTYIKPNRISRFGCLAHKIELAMMWSINRQADKNSRFAYLKKFESHVNKFYTYFLSRGSKRWGHYTAIAEQLDLNTRKLKYVYATRWADARLGAIKALHENYDTLKPVLISIDENESFNADAQETGRGLYELLQDQSFSIVLREFLDFLTVYKELSLKFQESASILVGKADYLESAYIKIRQLKLSPGQYVQSFLNDCECRYGCTLGTCSIEEYDNCNEIKHKGYVLEKVASNQILLSRVRSELYEYMLTELDRYLNIDILIAVQLFDNTKFVFMRPSSAPANVDLRKPIHQYYSMHYDFFVTRTASWKLAKICEFYYIDFDSECIHLARDWRAIMYYITTDTFLWDYKDSSPERFWPLALAQTRIPWTAITRKIIELTLVSGNNDAISERGFSVLDFTKSKSRTHLSPSTLSDLINIRENGPEELDDLKLNDYTRDFLTHHKRADEERNLGGRRVNENNFVSFFKKSRLF